MARAGGLVRGFEMPNEGSRPETIVVGAGLIGLAVAFELLRNGRTVTLLDRGRPGHGATRAAAGVLVSVVEAETEDPELDLLARESLERYPDFVAGAERISRTSAGYRIEESLWVAANHDDLEEMERVERTLGEKGVEIERLTPDGLLALEPQLSGRLLGGLRLERDHQVDPRRLAEVLRLAIEAMGGRVFEGMTVERIEEREGRIHAVGGTRTDGVPFAWAGSEVVVAAGAASVESIEMPVEDPGLHAVKGHLVSIRGAKLLDRLVRTPDIYLIPRTDDELLLATTVEEHGHDEAPSAGAVMDLLRHAWEVLPAIYDLELGEVSVGLISTVEDQRPVIGATAIDGLFLALGHSRDGTLMVPATAHHLSRWIVEGKPPAQLEPFSPKRMARDTVP